MASSLPPSFGGDSLAGVAGSGGGGGSSQSLDRPRAVTSVEHGVQGGAATVTPVVYDFTVDRKALDKTLEEMLKNLSAIKTILYGEGGMALGSGFS